MRIFLTGATGQIGSAVLDALLRAGHQVTALVRDNEKAARIAERGAHPVVGSLTEPESYRATADAQDGYVHTALDSSNAVAIDRLAIDTLLAAARRPRTTNSLPAAPRFFIYTSGIWVLGTAAEAADESAPKGEYPRAENGITVRSPPNGGARCWHQAGVNIGTAVPFPLFLNTTFTFCPIFTVSRSQSTMLVSIFTPSSSCT